MMVVDSVLQEEEGVELVVTSGVEGEHSEGSLHYLGLAWDGRKWTVPAERRAWMAERFREELGEDYDVVEEATHFHFEYQPKSL